MGDQSCSSSADWSLLDAWIVVEVILRSSGGTRITSKSLTHAHRVLYNLLAQDTVDMAMPKSFMLRFPIKYTMLRLPVPFCAQHDSK